jgi:hypothetical protein
MEIYFFKTRVKSKATGIFFFYKTKMFFLGLGNIFSTHKNNKIFNNFFLHMKNKNKREKFFFFKERDFFRLFLVCFKNIKSDRIP